MNFVLRSINRRLAHYLTREQKWQGAAPPSQVEALHEVLQPGDVILVEGYSKISVAIKYLTQSTWSHAALYVGHDALTRAGHDPSHCIVEADAVAGVRSIPLESFARYHTRICRPYGLQPEARDKVVNYVIQRLGNQYDLRNIWDLARYLIPTPPVPSRWRRRMLYLGSGDPTRAICSTLLAQAFQSVRFPILPLMSKGPSTDKKRTDYHAEILRVRHYSLFTPRDFDSSPYFQIIKPTIERKFDYRQLRWSSDSQSNQPLTNQAKLSPATSAAPNERAI